MNPLEPGFPLPVAAAEAVSPQREVRCAVRFPLTLPFVLTSTPEEVAGFTRNISACGVLFAIDCGLRKGSSIRFSLRLPHAVLGTPQDVLVRCTGRVVRCSMSQNQYFAAATIDEYQFIDQ